MPYKYKGEDISEEFVIEGFENSSFDTLDDYISATDGLQLIEEEEETQDFQNGIAGEDAPVVPVNPSRASIIAGVQQEATESPSVDISSESEDPKPRFIELESGNIIYEDTYLKTKAGQKGYPTTFNEYAEAFGTRPKEFDTDEIVVQATSSFEKLPELKNTWKSRTYNKDKGVFEVNNFNKELFGQEEETAVEIFRNLYKGSGIEFEETDQITDSSGEEIPIERRFLPQLGTEAVAMKILDPSTGEYIYSKPIELQNDKVSERNNNIINDFIESNKDKINIPDWSKESNKLDVGFAKWKKEQFNPQLAIKEDQASEEYLTNEDLFNTYDKYVYTKGIKQDDGTTISGTSRVLKTIQPYEDEINEEVIKIKRKSPDKSNKDVISEAKIAVRNNLYESARNESIYNLNEQYINESEDTEKAQGLLYASLIKEKTNESENYNTKSKKFQIASEKVKESRDDLKRVLTLYSEAGKGGVEAAKELGDIVKKYSVDPVAAAEVVNDPVFNSKFNLNKEANVSANLYNLFNAIDSSFNSNASVTKDASKEVDSSIGNISDIATSMNAVSKNYELHEKYLSNVGLGLSDIVVGTGYLGASILTLGQSEDLKKLGSKYVQATNEIRESYVRDVAFDDAFSSAANTGKFIGQEVSNQIPILAAMIMSGGAASLVVGASSAGGKMMDMQNEITTGSADYSNSEVWLKSLGYGLAEGVFAQLTTVPILNRAKLNWIDDGAEQLLNNSTKNYFKAKAPGLVYEPLLEAAGEIATVGTQNLIDGKPFVEGMDHAGASGFGFGLIFAGVPFFKGMYNSQFSTYESLSEVRKIKSSISDLERRLETSQSSNDSESVKQIKDLINTKTERLNDKIKEQEVIVNNNLTHRGASFVTKIVEEQVKIQNEAQSIQKNKNLDNNTKSELIDDLKNQFNNLVQIKQRAVSEDAMLANETEWEAFKGLDRLKSQEYLNTAESILKDERDGREVNKEDVNRKAYDLYFGDIVRAENAKQGKPNSTVFKKFKSFETVEDAIADLDSQENLDAEEKNRIIKGLKQGNDGYANPITNTQVAVVENQVKNQRKYTKTHEVGHAAFWNLLGKDSNNKAFKDISNQLLTTLEATDKKVYDKFIKDGIDDDKGNILPAEVISRFLEYVSENKITNVQKAKGVAGLFGVIVQKQFNKDYDFDFRGEQDIFNFVVGIGKKIKDGTLTTSDIKAAKEGDLIKGITEDVVDVEAEVKTDFSKNKELDNEIKESIKKKGKEISALVPEGTTKKQYDRKIVGDVYEKLIATDYLDKTIKNQFEKNKIITSQGKVYDENIEVVIEDIKQRLLEGTILRYNPEVNKDFGGYLISELVNYRIGDVTNKLKAKKGTKRLDAEAGTLGSVQELADQSVNIEDQIDAASTVSKQDSKLTKATKILSKEQYNEASEIIKEKIKDIDPKNLSYKKVGGFITDILSYITSVPADKILDSTKNLSQGQVTTAAMFIEKNIDYIRRTLPEGAVLGAATEKLMGTSTGVANSVLKKLYDKNPRIKKGQGLSPWTLKKGLNNNDILEAIGRPKGVEPKPISPRSPEGQVIKGILNIVDKNITNELVRTVESDLTLEQKQDVAAGKALTMFSKEAVLEEGINPKTLLSTKASRKTLSKTQVKDKSNIIFDDTEALFLNNIGDVDSFLNNTVEYLKNIKLKDKDLQKNIRRIATASSTRGNLTEYYNWHKLDNNNALKEALGIKKLIPKKWNSSNDIEAEFNDGTIEGIEVKMNWKDIMGSGGLFFDGKKVKSYTYNNGESKISDDIVNEINNNTEIINKLLIATENASKVESVVKDGKVGMPFALLSDTESQARSSREQLNRPKFKDVSMSIDQVLNHYKKKDVGLFIVSDELFYVQDKRGKFKEMGIPKLNTDASIKLRVKTSGIKNRKRTNDFVDSYSLTAQYQFDKKPEQGIKFSKVLADDLDKSFNDILENKSGIPSRKRYGIVEAITKGSSKGRFNFFIPPSAEDFVGLLYPTLGKGELGDAQMSWYKKNLIDPYAEGMNKISKARVYMMNTYDSLKKQLDVVPKDLAKKIEGTDYTREQAVRVYIWNKQKMNIPGISDADVSELVSYVADDANLQTFGDQLINMQMGDGYVKPKEGWPAGTITTDILEGLNTTKRAKYLKNWQENVDAIFSEENLNKLQAIYGLNYRKALVNVLKRMKSGRNRDFPGDSLTGRFTDWTTGSVGTIMFLNTRSAVLQTISAINFVNFTDNNILAAGKAFANQKQYWADFMKLMNSDFLKERRGGLRINVNEADIAEMAKKGGVKGAISKLLELGFAPTQIADSFAIASGGSAFYRNRINTYLKQKDANGNNLYTEKQAEKKAFEDFRETAEESQQSSRADRISMQQASPLGRVVLAFANTPAQYARIIKKAASDLKNGRGDRKENISKIIYYGFAQNLIFNALQQALFAVGFGDDEAEDKEKEKKYVNIANGMLDSILRGSGIGGAIVSVGKNAVIKIIKELEKDRPKLQNIAAEVLKISPPISAKYSRLVQAGKSYDWNKDQMREKGLSLDNPAYLAGGNVLSALTNIPLDRVIKKANNVVAATSQDLETWERLALLAGWQQWEIGIKKEKKKKKKGRLKSNKLKIKKLDL
tara:strand:- start:1472 stop:9292 length:7821 start_codon:yes stop_codon:yes gene_type:complete